MSAPFERIRRCLFTHVPSRISEQYPHPTPPARSQRHSECAVRAYARQSLFARTPDARRPMSVIHPPPLPERSKTAIPETGIDDQRTRQHRLSPPKTVTLASFLVCPSFPAGKGEFEYRIHRATEAES